VRGEADKQFEPPPAKRNIRLYRVTAAVRVQLPQWAQRPAAAEEMFDLCDLCVTSNLSTPADHVRKTFLADLRSSLWHDVSFAWLLSGCNHIGR